MHKDCITKEKKPLIFYCLNKSLEPRACLNKTEQTQNTYFYTWSRIRSRSLSKTDQLRNTPQYCVEASCVFKLRAHATHNPNANAQV